MWTFQQTKGEDETKKRHLGDNLLFKPHKKKEFGGRRGGGIVKSAEVFSTALLLLLLQKRELRRKRPLSWFPSPPPFIQNLPPKKSAVLAVVRSPVLRNKPALDKKKGRGRSRKNMRRTNFKFELTLCPDCQAIKIS